MTRKKKFLDYTVYRKLYVNVIWCVVFLIGVIILPSIFNEGLKYIIHNKYVCNLLSNLLFILFVVVIYFRDLVKEYKRFKTNIKDTIRPTLKYYITGLMLMIFFNIILAYVVKNISLNESSVREMLFDHKIYMLISITLIAPVMEELVFRKSIFTVIRSKWVYATVSGLLFGLAHILVNFTSGTFVFTDLLYILPYGSFGFMFAVMDYESDTVFSSIMMHSMHNLLNGILLINLHLLGVL